MAQTKVKLISDGVIDVHHLASGHSITTDNIGEGSNLYYTDARVSTYLSTNNYATEGYVTTAVANLVDSAPTTLDTLNELAAALGDDPNFATTVTNSIATKLPLTGGNITGTLGIGAATQVRKLHVDGGSIAADTPTIRISSTDSSGTNKFGIEFYSNNGADVRGKILADNNGRVYIDDNGGGGVVLQANGGSGNVGIGTTPSAWSLGGLTALQIRNGGLYGYDLNEVGVTANAYYNAGWKYIANDSASMYFQDVNSNHVFRHAASGTSGSAITWSESMRINSSGNVGIGTTTPQHRLDIQDSTATILLRGTSNTVAAGDVQGSILFYNNDASTAGGARVTGAIKYVSQDGFGRHALTFGTSTTDSKANFGDPGTYTDSTIERMRIHENGDITFCKSTTSVDTNGVFIQNTADGAVYSSIGSPYNTYHVYNTLNNRYDFYVTYNGTIYARDVTIQSLSDQRLKENIQDLNGGLDKILALRPRTFDFKDGSKLNAKGFVAQEVEQVLPECVKEYTAGEKLGDGTRYKTVGQDFMPYLVKAIQEQQEIINNLKAEVEALKQQLNG